MLYLSTLLILVQRFLFIEISIDCNIDVGATDHISCNSTLFTDLKCVVKSFVFWPNGQKGQVLGVETVHLSHSLVLHNALFISEFSFNLMSVSMLIDTGKICVSFMANNCIIQNLFSWKKIGLAKQEGGLFILKAKSICLSSIAVLTLSYKDFFFLYLAS